MDRVLAELSGLISTTNAEIVRRGGTVPSGTGSGAAVGGSTVTVGKHGEVLDSSKARKPSVSEADCHTRTRTRTRTHTHTHTRTRTFTPFLTPTRHGSEV
jgi:hypothetical protein